MNAASTIAVARAAARRRIVRELESAGATSERDAISLRSGRLMERRTLQALVNAGAVRDAGEGRYWLHAEDYDGYMRGLRRRMFAVVGGVLALAGLGLAIGR